MRGKDVPVEETASAMTLQQERACLVRGSTQKLAGVLRARRNFIDNRVRELPRSQIR